MSQGSVILWRESVVRVSCDRGFKIDTPREISGSCPRMSCGLAVPQAAWASTGFSLPVWVQDISREVYCGHTYRVLLSGYAWKLRSVRRPDGVVACEVLLCNISSTPSDDALLCFPWVLDVWLMNPTPTFPKSVDRISLRLANKPGPSKFDISVQFSSIPRATATKILSLKSAAVFISSSDMWLSRRETESRPRQVGSTFFSGFCIFFAAREKKNRLDYIYSLVYVHSRSRTTWTMSRRQVVVCKQRVREQNNLSREQLFY